MTKNPAKINKTNNTITYTDASGSVIISLNSNQDITVSHTGKLSQTALDLISLAYNDTMDKAASKEALTEIKRLNALMNNKAKAAEVKKLRTEIMWNGTFLAMTASTNGVMNLTPFKARNT